MFRLAPEGFPFIVFFSAITVVALTAGGGLTAIGPLILTFFMFYFFRDPERITPEGEGLYVSPADGRIILIQSSREEQYLNGEAIEVGIFMSPLNVHVNRSPCSGTVKSVVHTPGKFLSAFKPEASLLNENIALLIEQEGVKILVRQVAGFLARRAVCRVRPGDSLIRGQRYGIIKFSSRLDVYLPPDTALKVKVGDRVRAGETVIGTR